MMCVTSGQADIYLVPHVFKQEVEAGENVASSKYGETPTSIFEQAATSPINFIMPMSGDHREFLEQNKKVVNLSQGDCIFIPAFYFYQVQAHKITMKHMKFKNLYTNKDPSLYSKREADIATVVSL